MSELARDRLLRQTAVGPGLTPFMIAANYFPLVYLVLGGWLAVRVGGSWLVGLGLVLIWTYLLPPVTGRILLAVFGKPDGVFAPDSRSYRVWWTLTQLQMPFNRIGLLEELLRFVPGLYGLWLNLWGSRVSLLVYWSPGVMLTDRYLLRVGRGAALGARCLIGGHLVTRDADGEYELTVAEVTIGDRAIVGAGSAIGPGCEIHPDEVVPAGRYFGPFSGWKDGRRSAARRHSPEGGSPGA